MKSKVLLTAGLLFAGLAAYSQLWVEKMLDPNVNFYDAQQEFNNYWNGRSIEKGKGFKQFKRWEYFMEPRVYPSGNKNVILQGMEDYRVYLEQQAANKNAGANTIQSSTWTKVGPIGVPTNGGAGRLNAVRFHPTNTNTMYVCAPAGGLWVSTNGGTSWTTNTDNLATIGTTDVVVDPTNTQVMYLATGDGDAGDTYTIGVWKSTNGGSTWSVTGLNWTYNQQRRISKLLIHPTNTQILLAATSNGVYRTTNGGTSWTQVLTGNFKDIEFNPQNPNMVYVSGTTFYRSSNNGQNWTQVTTGLPTTGVARIAIGVTPADTSYVYLLIGRSSDNGLQGVYRSTNSGGSFSTMATTPNLLGWQSNGSDAGGQAWYDLAIAVSPTNANEVVTGGVNIWRSTNGGSTWSIYGHWTGSGAPYVHADIHDLIYKSNGTLYVACDGGVYQRNSTSYVDLSATMDIAQPYRIGLSASNANLIISGHQDNGTNRYNGSWARVMGGDGMDCAIDWNNNNVMYGEQYNGALNRSTNGGANWTAITSGLSGTAPWMTPFHQDPNVANTIYCGYSQLFKSTNQGTNWSQIGTMSGSGTITEFAVAKSNSQVIYAIKGSAVHKTTNGGTSWTALSGLPALAPTYIAISPTNPNNVWITFSGFTAGTKVYQSTNGGTSWTNVSNGLPNLPANTICYQPGTNDGLYVGMDAGVYFKDNTMTNWAPYNTGLPNVPISDLEFYQPTGKLRAATYGRSVWEVDAYNPGNLAPIAAFTSDKQVVCPGMAVTFTDMSSFTPTSWNWTFQGGTPATSTQQNPVVTYNTPGTYSVQLIAINANGQDTAIQTSYITVSGVNALPLSEGFVNATFPPANWTTRDFSNDAVFWARSATVGYNSSDCMWFDNYTLNSNGTKDEMQTPKYNFSGYSSATLTFDVAYRQYDNTYSDTLVVLVSTDCGVTWTPVYTKGGSTLSTVAGTYTTNAFVPSGSTQWRNESVNMTPYVGQPNVMVAFQNRGYWGQALYVDNINITGVPVAGPPTANFTSAATKCTGTAVQFTDASSNSPTGWTWSTTPTTGVTITTASSQNPTITFTNAGTYTVTLVASNASGSSAPFSQTVTVVATPTINVNSPAICSGNSATLTATGGTTYSWNTGATTNTISVTPTVTTTYTVTGTTSGCSASKTATVTVNTSPTVNATAANSTICNGSNTTITATGASTYTWAPGGATGATTTVTPTVTTTYTVTGTASNGCTGTKTVTITVNPLPNVTVNSPTICAGSSATLTASGGTTYSWNTGATTTTISVSPTVTTTYTVTGTTSGCSKAVTSTVTVNAAPTVNATAANSTICSGSSTTITATGASTYTWTPGGATGTSTTVSPGVTTTYTVTGTGANGCTGTKTVTITVNATPTVSVNNASVCSGAPAVLTASGATTYSWSTGSTAATITVTPSTQTVYTVTGTSNGCTSTTTTTVNVANNPTVVATGTTVCAGTPATISASGANTYSWNTGATGATVSVTPTVTTTYTVTGTDANGCSNTATAQVVVNPLPNVSFVPANDTVCENGGLVALSASPSGGSFSGTGVTGSSFDPSGLNGPITITYSYTDANNCSNTVNAVINVENCTGINTAQQIAQGVMVYPNPSHSQVTIKLSLTENLNVNIELTDVIGKSLAQSVHLFSVADNTFVMDLDKYTAGIYFLKLSANGKSQMIRIIKE